MPAIRWTLFSVVVASIGFSPPAVTQRQVMPITNLRRLNESDAITAFLLVFGLTDIYQPSRRVCPLCATSVSLHTMLELSANELEGFVRVVLL